MGLCSNVNARKEAHSLGHQLCRLAYTKMASFLLVVGGWSRKVLPDLVLITGLNPNSQVLGSSIFSFHSQKLFGIWNHSPNPGYSVIRKVGLTTYGSPFIVSMFLLDAVILQLCLCYTCGQLLRLSVPRVWTVTSIQTSCYYLGLGLWKGA